MVAAEVYASLTALKTAFDLARGLKDIDDATRRNAAVIELQEKILAAQSEQAALIERSHELQSRVAQLEAWGAEVGQKPIGIIKGPAKTEASYRQNTFRLPLTRDVLDSLQEQAIELARE